MKQITALSVLYRCLLCVAGGDVCQDSSSKSCDECMSAHPNCVWIIEKEIKENETRCRLYSDVSGRQVVHGGNTSSHNEKDDDFRLPSDGIDPAIQIRPQKIKMKIRVNEEQKFTLTYKALSNYPLDLYYLVDQTYSMKDHVEDLRTLSETLRTDLVQLTNNSRIAFGYFSDKVSMPYYSMVPERLESPCPKDEASCVPGSNFVHAVNFSEDTAKFSEQIKHFNFTANLDDPEGALDAIMQILLCDAFGWRMYSRKMIVLATDGLLHTAGEGVLGGLVARAPAECRMRQSAGGRMIYDGLANDYPSLEEVYRRLREKKTSVLFAIQERDDLLAAYYKRMNDLLSEVSFLSLMRAENNNILAVLEEGFRDVVKKVQFKVVDSPSYLQFDAMARCHGEQNKSWSCWNLELDKEYAFDITVKLVDTPVHKRDVIRIEEMNLHESVEIEVEYPEICSCEDEVDTVDDPLVHGIFKCGVYICAPMWVGERCDRKCDPTTGKYGNATSRMCSGHGDFHMATCRCECDHGYAGSVCQVECGTDNMGKVCSKNGKCGPNGCQCYAGYNGTICDCPLATETCVQPGAKSNIHCNRHGTCQCGECDCEKGYKGKYCQICPDCENCRHDNNVLDHIRGKLAPEKREFFVFWGTTELNLELHQCIVYYNPNSTHTCSVYYSIAHSKPIRIDYYQECQHQQYFYYKASFGIVGLVVFILLIPLLSWKVYTVMKDRREFANFQKNAELAKFEMNPHYDDPIRTYKNPLKTD